MTDIRRQRELVQTFLTTAAAVLPEDRFLDQDDCVSCWESPLEFSRNVDPEDEALATYHICDKKGYRTLPPGREWPELKP